jgi:hypothetical protein
MKRLIAVLAVSLAMAFGLAACNPDDGTGGGTSPDSGLESPAGGGLESPDLMSPAAS